MNMSTWTLLTKGLALSWLITPMDGGGGPVISAGHAEPLQLPGAADIP